MATMCHGRIEVVSGCEESIVIFANVVMRDFLEAVKMAGEVHVPFQQFVQRKQGPRVGPHSGGVDHECPHARRRGGMVGWDDAKHAKAPGDLVKWLE